LKLLDDPYFKKWLPVWIHNASENYTLIKKDFLNRNSCLTSLPRPMNKPAVIIGAGPSLDKNASLLKKWRGTIFSPTSVAFVPTKFGHEPEFIVGFDSLWQTAEQIKGYTWKKSTLITHPNVDPLVIKAWKWKKLYFRRMYPKVEYFELILPMMFPFIRLGVVFTGNVVNASVSIASFLGYNPIFLVGVDYAYYNNVARAISYIPYNNGWKEIPARKITEIRPEKMKQLFNYKDGIQTEDSNLSFKSHLLNIWASDNINLISCSHGIIDELPYVDFEKVVKSQGSGFNDLAIPKETKQQKAKEFINYIQKRNKQIENKKKMEKIK